MTGHKPRGIRGPIETSQIRPALCWRNSHVTSRVEYAALLKPERGAVDDGLGTGVTSRVEYAALLKHHFLKSVGDSNAPWSQAAWNTRPY